MVLGNTANETCAQISSLDAVRGPVLLTQCINLHLCLYIAAIQNVAYGCGNVPEITAESSRTPPIHCAQYVQQSIDMSIQLPGDLQCNPVQMAEVVQQENVLISSIYCTLE